MRSLSRRAFLTAGGAAALTLGAMGTPSLVASQAARLKPATSATIYTQATFQAQVGTAFVVHVGAQLVTLALDAVKALAQVNQKGRALSGQQFSLVFSGPAPTFGQLTYAVQHAVLGTFSLFLVPVGPEAAGGQAYQAIVNNAALGQP